MLIENPKTYKGTEVETIFFRPSFCGKSAEELGIRVLYNLPMPTTVQVWSKPDNVLQAFASGWSGGQNATKQQKTINMHKVKAETAFSADDYFSMVFEKITGNADVNMGDLTGTELEKAETELFRQAIAEGVRATMWLGDTDGEISSFTTFNGFLKAIREAINDEPDIIADNITSGYSAITAMKLAWDNATADLKALRSEGNLVYLVSSDILNKYMEEVGIAIHERIHELSTKAELFDYYSALFEQLGEYRDIGITAYRNHLGELILNNIIKNMAVSFPPVDDSADEHYRHLYLAGAFYSVFIEWLKTGKREDVREMARICCNLAYDGNRINKQEEQAYE